MGSSQSTSSSKKSLYERYQEKKAHRPIADEDLIKYTGKTRDEICKWADDKPGVGKNQLAGKITIGSANGLGGMAAAGGRGGWGWSAEPKGANRGMKFPPGGRA